MKNRSLIYGLAVLFLAVGAAETWSQECSVSCHRPETLIHLLQQRLWGAQWDCGCTSKSQVQKGAAAEKVAPVTKAMAVHKASSVQKAPCVQKSVCTRVVSDNVRDCKPCGFSRPRPVAVLSSRWNGTQVTTKDLPRSRKGCGCEPDLSTDLSEPIPMIEKPQIDNNPFRDDALQPAPLPGARTREARVLPRPLTNDPADSTNQQPAVRYASYYLLSVEAD